MKYTQASKANHYLYNPKLKELARKLRNNMTKSEVRLWGSCLKHSNFHGFPFRRQRPIGPYIVDFVSFDLMLVIELDGHTHDYRETYLKDIEKTNFLANSGFEVIRFQDELVLYHMDLVKTELEKWAVEHKYLDSESSL